MSREEQRVRATLCGGGWFSIAVRFDRSLIRSIRQVRPRLYERSVWMADLIVRRATWSFPLEQLKRVRAILQRHGYELVVPGDPLEFRLRYRDKRGRFARRKATP